MTAGVVKLLSGFENFLHNPFKSGVSLSDFADAANVDISVKNMGAKFEFETEIEEAKSFSVPLLGAPVSLIGLEVSPRIINQPYPSINVYEDRRHHRSGTSAQPSFSR